MKKINYPNIINIATDILLIILLIFPPILHGGVQQYVIFLIHLVTILILFLLLLKGFIEKNLSFQRTPLDIPVVIFLIISVFYTVNTIYRYGSFLELLKILNYIAIYYITVNHVRSRKKIKLFTWVIVIISVCLTLYGFKRSWEGITNLVSPSYVCHNHYAGFIELCLPLSLSLIFTEEKLGSISAAIASVINGFGLMYSMSRGGWMAFTAAFIFMVILFILKKDNFYQGEKERKIFLTNLITWVLILVVLSIPILVKEKAKTIVQVEKNQIGSEALSFRIPVWENTVHMIKDQNYLGKGLGSFIYLYPRYNKEMPELFMNAAHSDYLQMTVEAGLFGVISFLLIICVFYITVIRYLRYKGNELTPFTRELIKKDQLLLIGYTGAITGLFLHGIGDFNFQIPANVIYFFMIIGLAVSIKSLGEKNKMMIEEKISDNKKLIALTVLSSVILLIIAFITGESLIAEYYFDQGKKYENTLLWEKALEKYDISERLNPFNPSYYIQSGYISSKMTLIEKDKKDFWIKKSIDYYRKAVKLNQFESPAYYYLGNIYAASGQDKEAVESFNNVIKLNPYDTTYLITFATYRQLKGENEKAVELYEKYLIVKPNDLSIQEAVKKLRMKGN